MHQYYIQKQSTRRYQIQLPTGLYYFEWQEDCTKAQIFCQLRSATEVNIAYCALHPSIFLLYKHKKHSKYIAGWLAFHPQKPSFGFMGFTPICCQNQALKSSLQKKKKSLSLHTLSPLVWQVNCEQVMSIEEIFFLFVYHQAFLFTPQAPSEEISLWRCSY